MERKPRQTVAVLLGAILIAGAVWLAFQRYQTAAQLARTDVRMLKYRFLTAGEVEVAHHEVYHKVGEYAWEAQVKPSFLGQVTQQVVLDSGEPFPGEEQVLEWMKNHPEEARRLLEESGRPFDRSPKGEGPEPAEALKYYRYEFRASEDGTLKLEKVPDRR